LIVALLAYGLSGMFAVILYDRQSRSGAGLLFGIILGVVITVLAYLLGRAI